MEDHTPFREVWVALGKLRERLEDLNDADANELSRLLAREIDHAEKEWQVARRGPGLN